MGDYFLITKEEAKKFGVPTEKLTKIWQWYGEVELDSVLSEVFTNGGKEFDKEAVEILDKYLPANVPSSVFDSMDNTVISTLKRNMSGKWALYFKYISEIEKGDFFESREFTKQEAVLFVEDLEKNYNVDFTEEKELIKWKGDDFCICKYDNNPFLWTLESVEYDEVIIDGEVFETYIKE